MSTHFRTRVDSPKKVPDRSSHMSQLKGRCLSSATDLAKAKCPRKLASEKGASEYGANKKKDAGEKICSAAVMKASLVFEPADMVGATASAR